MPWSTVDAVFCHNCGHRNPEGVNFCSSCGNPLLADGDDATITLHPNDEAETSEENPRSRSSRSRTARVSSWSPADRTSERATCSGRRWSGPVATPRATSSSTTSRSRAATSRSRPKSGGYVLRDVGSLNGTYVNRERIDEVQLAPGDEVQIGKFKLVYLVAGNE